MAEKEDRKNNYVNLIDIISVIAKYKKLIFILVLVAAIVSGAVSFLMPPFYMAETRILPPQQGTTNLSSQLLSQMGGYANFIPGALGIKNPADMYIGILKSRTIYDRIIDAFGLMQLYETRYRDETRAKLEKRVVTKSGKDGIISLTVEDSNPKRAADIANAFVVELKTLNRGLAVTEAAQRRLFFEEQLSDVKAALSQSEEVMRRFQEKTGALKIDDQAKVVIAGIAQLRAQIAAIEVQRKVMQTYATFQNPDLQRVEEEYRGLKAELAKLEGGQGGRKGYDPFMSTERMPSIGTEYLRKLRDLKFNETLFELLAKQYELAKLDEARDASVIQVIDKAVPPDRSAKPRRAVIVGVTATTMLFLAVFLVFILEYSRNNLQEQNKKVEELLKKLKLM